MKEGVLHDGFQIMLEGDMRDYIADKYVAWVISDNEILLKIPSVGLSYINDFDLFFDEQKRWKTFCPRLQEGHNVARNAISDDEDRQVKKLLLRFPDDIVLADRFYFEDGSPDGELHVDVVQYDSTHIWNGITFPNTKYIVYWKVAIKEDSDRVVKKSISVPKTKAETLLEERLRSMSTK